MASASQSLDHHRLMAEHSSDVVYIVDPDGVVVWVSPALTRLLGWAPESVVGCPIRDLVHLDDAASTRSWRGVLVGAGGDGSARATDPLRFRRPDSTFAWCTVSATQAYDDDGTLIGMTARLHDVDGLVRTWQQAVDERARLHAVLDALIDPHVTLAAVVDDGGDIVDFVYEDANQAAAQFEGLPREEILGSTIRSVYRTDEEADEDVADCVRALATGRPVVRNDSRTLGYLDAEGRPVFVDIRIVPIDADRVSYTWRDITERHLSQERLAESEERFRLLAENMSDVVGLVVEGRTTWISPSVSRALGWSPSELIGEDPLALVHEEDRPALGRAWVDIQDGLVPRRRFRLRGADGRYHWVDVEGSAIPGEPGTSPTYVLSTRIVDAEVGALAALQDQARHDELTGLVNRHAVFDQLGRTLAGEARTGSRVAMAFCDLDGFKAVNDEYGHSAGDALLRAISRRLERAVRSGDVVARIGGDELLVILHGVHDLEEAVHIAENLRECVGQPTPVAGGTVAVSASIGVTLADAGESVDQIVARADAAMYEAKRRGKNTVVSFGPGSEG